MGGREEKKRNTEDINSNSRPYSFNRTFRASSALVQISGTQRGSSQLSDHVTGVLGESYFPSSLSWPQSPVESEGDGLEWRFSIWWPPQIYSL